jgi:hypothetical protein
MDCLKRRLPVGNRCIFANSENVIQYNSRRKPQEKVGLESDLKGRHSPARRDNIIAILRRKGREATH